MQPCNPDCPLCGGLGFIKRPSTGIHDPNFGKLDPCPESMKFTWDPLLGIDEPESRLLNWDLFTPSPSMGLMMPAFKSLLQRGYGWLYLWGPPGLGKTVAAKTAAIEAHYKHKLNARYMTHSGMINFLRASYSEENSQSAFLNRMDSLASIDYLAIDEVGRDRSTDFGINAFSDLLDRRYVSACHKKSITIFISNFSPKDVLDNYQLDRVMDGRFEVLHVKGQSYRLVASNNPKINYQEVPWWQKF